MGSRPPLQGFNHNIRYRDRVYHVQTEDSGLANPHLFSHLFHGGVIIATARTEYADLAKQDAHEKAVRKLMQDQHKTLMKQLRRGEYDDKIALMLGSLEPADAAKPKPEPEQKAKPEKEAELEVEELRSVVDGSIISQETLETAPLAEAAEAAALEQDYQQTDPDAGRPLLVDDEELTEADSEPPSGMRWEGVEASDTDRYTDLRDQLERPAGDEVVIVDRPEGEVSPTHYSHVRRGQPSRSGLFERPLPNGTLPPPVEQLSTQRESGVYPVPTPDQQAHPDPAVRARGSSPQRYTAPSKARFGNQRGRRETGSYEAVRGEKTQRRRPTTGRTPASEQPPPAVIARPAIVVDRPSRETRRPARDSPSQISHAVSNAAARQGARAEGPAGPGRPGSGVHKAPASGVHKAPASGVHKAPASGVHKVPAAVHKAPRAAARSLPSLFGSDLISERSLDEVILQYLAEDGEAKE